MEIESGDTIAKFAGRFDFDAMRARHRENFVAFLDFLHKNGLHTAFDGGGSVRPAPGSDVLEEDVPCERMRPLRDVSPVVGLWRTVRWFALVRSRKLRRRRPIGVPPSRASASVVSVPSV